MDKLDPNSLEAGPGADLPAPRPKRKHRRVKPQLLTRAELDGRSGAAKTFDAIARGIAADLGGEAQLSTVQKHLVEAFAGCAIHVNDLNVKLLTGQPVDILVHSYVISTLCRVASRIGLHRVAKDIAGDPLDYVRGEVSP
jgi:hypothetical protein